MDPTMNQSDHDTLIRLEAQLSAHSARESEVSRVTLEKLTELGAKFDQLRDSHMEQRRDIREIRAKQGSDDMRIASLETKVDVLQDESERAKAVAEATTKAAEARAKRYALITGAITFLIGAGPTIYTWISHLVNAGATP